MGSFRSAFLFIVASALLSCRSQETSEVRGVSAPAAGAGASAAGPSTAAPSTAAPSNASGPGAAACFPPEAVDHLAMTVGVDVEIFAIGKDSLKLEGTVAVHRSGPHGGDGKTLVGDMIGASLRGKSEVFGEVVAVQSPLQHSPCTYICEGPGRYRGTFDINGWFWLPRHDLFVFSSEPVRVEGIAQAIPPVGQKAEGAFREIALHDIRRPAEKPIGVLRRATGEVHGVVAIDEHLKSPDAAVKDLAK